VVWFRRRAGRSSQELRLARAKGCSQGEIAAIGVGRSTREARLDRIEEADGVTHLALLRGINVTGKNTLPMQDLVRIFEAAGGANVRTYIQSGNVIFDAPSDASKIAGAVTAAIEKRFGYRIPVVLRTAPQLRKVIGGNPFLKLGIDLKWLHVYFLAHAPGELAVVNLDPTRSAPDVFHVHGQEIYLHLPNGMGRSKLTNAYFDSKLATVSTARNWATVLKLAEMMQAR
jgi:uncharacterized protein (DUF1697 family)